MKFNTTLLYALMAAGLMLPMASVQAWPTWLGGTPLLKVQEKAQEEAKKEAVKNSSIVADLAWKGTKAVGTAAVKTAWFTTKETAKFAYNNPRTAATLAGAGYLYYKRNDISNWVTRKYEQAKAIANTVAPVASAALALKLASDVLAPFQSQAAAPVQSAASQANRNALTDAWVDEFNAREQREQQEREQAAAELESKEKAKNEAEEKAAMEVAWNQSHPQTPVVNQEAERIKRAQERLKFENAWKAAQSQAVEVPTAKADTIDAELKETAHVLNQAEQASGLTDTLDQREVQRNAQAFLNPEPVLDPLQFVERQSADNDWVQEFNKLQTKKGAEKSAWVKEFQNQRSLERAANIIRHLVDAAKDNDDMASVESAEDSRARSMHKDVTNMTDRLQPACPSTASRF